MEFQKKLISTNQNKVNNDVRQLEGKQKYFQQLVDKIAPTGIELNGNDLETLIATPKTFFVDKLTKGEEMKLSGVLVDKEQVYKLIHKPQGVEEVVNTINTDSTDASKRELYHWHVEKFVVAENNVNIKPSVLVEIMEQNSVYIENDKQAKAWELMQQTAKDLNNLRLTFFDFGIAINTETIEEMFNTDAPTQTVTFENTPNAHFLKSIK